MELARVLPDGKRVLIIPHDYPDPDALASAAAIHLLLMEKFKVRSQIAFSGAVSRAENRELLRQYRYKWHLLSDLRFGAGPVPCIFVDTAPWSRNVTLPPGALPIAVIDHHQHKCIERDRECFLDIRCGAGASTTIAYEYLKSAGIPIPRWLAAVMAYAIASETLDLWRDSDKSDINAYVDLVGSADLKVIGKIRHAPLPRAYYARLMEALTHARKLDQVAWSHLGSVEQPEIVAEIADLLLRMEGITWSFCTARINGGLFVSMRSSSPMARCSRILQRVMARDGQAGGHNRMAAGYLHMDALSDEEKLTRRSALVGQILGKISKRFQGTANPEESSQPLALPPGGVSQAPGR